MGTEYYLINKEDKTFYKLGKGGWYALKDEIESVTDLEYLALFIWQDVFSNDDEEDVYWNQYCTEIATEIFEVAKCNNIKNLVVVDDGGDDTTIIKALKYRCIGSRYRDPNDPNFKKSQIEEANRHLLPEYENLNSLERLLQPTKPLFVGNRYISSPSDPVEHPLQSLVDKYLKVE
jgi:hypothetical protein